MNRRLICRLLGMITLLLGASMAMSLPWAFPAFGQVDAVEGRSVVGLVGTVAVCGALGGWLVWLGRRAPIAALYRREAIAVVGLSWLLATLLGAMPFWLSRTATARTPNGEHVLVDLADGLFESASGFTGTGATVLTDIEDPELVPRAVLFWRSQTHFLGGLGIMVLFVAILGMGSAGKALMLAEMPGPSQESSHSRTQRAAWVFALIFVGLTATVTVLLRLEGMTVFDALCHAFGTVATGGFGTYNKSIEHFQSVPIEMTIAVFVIVACTNFTLLYHLILLKPRVLLADVEFRTYLGIIATVTALIVGFGLASGDFAGIGSAVRYALFQVASIITNTGFGSADFDRWNQFSRALLLALMFIGGCAGSTSCSVKVIRYVLLFKILRLELEQVFHPNVVRHVKLGGRTIEDPALRKEVLLYFTVILLLFVTGWMLLVATEPDSVWIDAGRDPGDKLLDCASAVATTLNGVGPGLGIVGVSQNFAALHGFSKLVLAGAMLLGRLEVFVLLVLFVPRFWSRR